MKKPQLEDFYDEQDPRGCSTSEYNEYLKALKEYKAKRKEVDKLQEQISKLYKEL